jgi:hypothetical protein
LHRLIRQHLTGIPVEVLSKSVTNPELRDWWRNYLDDGPANLPSQHYPEVMLSTMVKERRLVARYDLVAIGTDERVVIVDWKTNRKHPQRRWLAERLQTRVYPYVLVQAGHVLGDRAPIRPDSVTIVYWFANFASAPERFTYDASQCRDDEQYLLRIIGSIEEEIDRCPDDGLLPPTTDRRRCRICRYRSLCQRGVEAGWLGQTEAPIDSQDPFDFDLDFEQIAELEIG